MRTLLLGAVEGTRVALREIAAAPGWTLAGVATLPPQRSARHSDYVDLSEEAARLGVELFHVGTGNEADFVEQVRRLQLDCLFVVGWSQLCGPALCEAAGGRVIGYHPAALPRLRGRAAIPWTILLDEKITASTLFWIDAGVDAGPVIAQRFFHVAADETAASLYARHMAALAQMLREHLPAMAHALPAGTDQDERFATYAAKRRPADGEINWSLPGAAIERLVRAVGQPYPGAVTTCAGTPITVWQAALQSHPGRFHALPGQVVQRSDHGFSVMCGDGSVLAVVRFDGSVPALHAHLGNGG